MEQVGHLPERFRALDAWRGICALLIVLFHAPTLHLWKDAPAFANLQLCVDFFFVLSGFVLSHAQGKRAMGGGQAMRFLLARFRRLWPLHIVLLAGLVALEGAKLAFGHADPSLRLDAAPFSEGHTGTEIVTSALFLQGFGLHSTLTWNGPSWSIAAEFWVSVLFALVLVAGPQRREALFAGLAALGAAVLWAVSPDTIFVSASWALPRCMLGFFTGCLVYRLRVRAQGPAPSSGLAEAMCVLLAAAFVLATRQGPQHLLAPAVFGLMIYVFSFERGPLSAVLRTSGLQALGRWSFAIYMTHGIVFQLARTAGSLVEHRLGIHAVAFHHGDKLIVAGTGAQALAAALAFIALVVVPVGALCHRVVERPLNRWLSAPSVVAGYPVTASR